jgi:hypothetical protein
VLWPLSLRLLTSLRALSWSLSIHSFIHSFIHLFGHYCSIRWLIDLHLSHLAWSFTLFRFCQHPPAQHPSSEQSPPSLYRRTQHHDNILKH